MKNNNIKLNLSEREGRLLDDYFEDVISIHGELPKQITIEAVEFKGDDSYGNGDEYNTMLNLYGKPNAAWIADSFCEYAMDGRNKKELTSALNKLINHKYMKIDAETGVVTYNTTRIIGEEENEYGIFEVVFK